jgi:hypothetical protein
MIPVMEPTNVSLETETTRLLRDRFREQAALF